MSGVIKKKSFIRENTKAKDDFPYTLQSQSVYTLLEKFTSKNFGVNVKDRTYHFKKYKQCFVGYEATQWMKKNNETDYTEEQLSEFLEILRKIGVFQHVVHQRKPFENKYLFFRFTHLTENPETIRKILVTNYEHVVKIRSILKSKEEIINFYDDFSNVNTGIDIGDRQYHLKVYKSCFVAEMAIEWISDYFSISTTASIYVGDMFRRLGLIRHVVDEKKPFQDAFLFFIINNKETALKLMEDKLPKLLESKFLGVFRYSIEMSEEQKESIKDTMEFGIDPELVMQRSNEKSKQIPHVYEELLEHITKNGLEADGIFRLSGDTDDISEYRLRYDFGEKVDLKELEIYTVASLFKLYLKIMPEPIIPFDLYQRLKNTIKLEKKEMIDKFIEIFKLLSQTRKQMFVNLMRLMVNIEKNSKKNLMTKESLSTVVGINVLRSENPDMKTMVEDATKSSQIFSNLIEFYDEYCPSII
eukprot:gene11083-3789_t